jgi:CoA:oxalate CoA-transferase
MHHPKAGVVPMQGFSVNFSASPMQLRHPPPMLGEHASALLQEWLGMDAEEVDQLRAHGTI